jgi:Predicted membrane protein (DUF2339)
MDLVNLEKRLASIESRLSEIESNFSKPNNQLITSSKNFTSSEDDHNLVQPPISSSNEEIEKSRGNWLGIIAVICFVLAGGFIIKLSIETGWLTAERQVGIAILFGISLIFSRTLLINIDNEYSSFLPAAGIIVLYLATFAAHRYYSLISFTIAISLVCIISAICTWLYIQIKHDVYTIIAAVGAYISPILIDLNSNTIFSLYYFLLCSITFSFISIWVHSRTLTVISAYLAILITGLIGAIIHQDLLVAIILVLHFLVFSFGSYLYSRLNNLPLSIKEAWSFLPILLIFYAMEYKFLDNIQPNIAPWVSLSFAIILNGLYLSAKKYLPETPGGEYLVLAFTTIVCFHSLYLELLPVNIRPWLLVIISFIIAFFPTRISLQKQINRFCIPIVGILLILATEYLAIIKVLFFNTKVGADIFIVSFSACIAIWVVNINVCDKFDEQKNMDLPCLL